MSGECDKCGEHCLDCKCTERKTVYRREPLTKDPIYGIQVYEDHAIIEGMLTSDILTVLIKLCRKEGFTHLIPNNEGKGFKLVRNAM